MASNNLGDGNIELDLDGEIVTLKPTLRGALAISRQLGGVQEALQKVVKLDIEAICLVVAAGLGVTGQKEVDQLGEKVWRTGAGGMVEPVARYLGTLVNPSGAAAVEGGDKNPPK